jgi:CRP-like cAMP-binding protein
MLEQPMRLERTGFGRGGSRTAPSAAAPGADRQRSALPPRRGRDATAEHAVAGRAIMSALVSQSAASAGSEPLAAGHAVRAESDTALLARGRLVRQGWLADCPTPFAEAVLEACEIVEVPRGETILRFGEPGRGLCGLAAGALYVAVAGPDGTLHKIHLGAPGLWLGETALLGETARRISVSTTVDSCIAWLAADAVAVLAENAPETWRHLGRLAAMNTTSVMTTLSCLLVRDSTTRVAQKLLQVDQRETPHLSLTQTALGEMVGLSRNTLNRVLGTLERAGAVHVGYARIQVRDRARLQALAQAGGGAD